MQINKVLSFVLLVSYGVVQPTINFGSRDAGFIINNGLLALGSASLSEGTLIMNSDSNITSSGMHCSHMRLEKADDIETGSIELNGNISLGASLVLNTENKLTVDGGTITESVSVFSDESAPAIIEGHGRFDHAILVSSPCALALRWDGPLNTDIDLQSSNGVSKLVLQKDLLLSPHSRVRSSFGDNPIIACNGFRLLLGGDAVMETILTDSMVLTDANIELTGPVRLDNAIYSFNSEGAFINGSGNRFMFSNDGKILANGVLVSCTHMTFTNVNAFSFISQSVVANAMLNVGMFRFRDVIIESYSESGVKRSLSLTGDIISESIDIFDGDCNFGAAVLTMNTDIRVGDSWRFSEDATINGNNFHLNLNDGELSVDEGCTLTLRNIVLDYVTTYSIYGSGTIHMSGVTIIVDRDSGNIDWTGGPRIIIDGPVTVVTGDRTISVNSMSEINGVTVFYDALGTGAVDSIVGFVGSGRAVSMDKIISDTGPSTPQNLSFTTSDQLAATEYLYPALAGMTSRVMTFAKAADGESPAGGDLVFDGKGRSIVCPSIQSSMLSEGDSSAVIVVGDGIAATQVTLTNLTIEGFKFPYVAYMTEGDTLNFGNHTRLILQEDWMGELTLDRTFVCGSSTLATYEKIVIDLQGHVLDLGNTGALMLQGAGNNELHIINGRVRNLAQTNLACMPGNTLVFKDVILELADAFVITNGAVRFEGNCTITGLSGTAFIFGSAEQTLTIASGARVTLTDGMVYRHNNQDSTSFVFADSTAQLELVGAAFAHCDTENHLQLTKGSLLIDHKVFIDAGTNGGIWLGDGESANNNVTVEIRPGATITVQSGLLKYANVVAS